MAVRSREDLRYPELANNAKDWIEGRVYGGLKAGYRGSLAVLGAGFGKGLVATAAVIAGLTLIAAVISPPLVGLAASATVAQSVAAGVTAALNLLFSPGGLALMALGGGGGSLVEAHAENGRITKEAAMLQAKTFAEARECHTQLQQQLGTAPKTTPGMECKGGHCARLMQEAEPMQGQAR